MLTYVQGGDKPDVLFVNVAAAGIPVLIGNGLFGVPFNNQGQGTLGPLAITGVFKMSKAAGAVTPGAKAYWDNTNKKITGVATGNTYVGAFPVGAADADAFADVRLHGGPI
jgi:predicted RecA/RadA family phage recombinase